VAKRKRKQPQTRPMRIAGGDEFMEWAQGLLRPTPDDVGEAPPPPPRDLYQPRPHGTSARPPQTRPMRIASGDEFTEWVQSLPRPAPDDTGEAPPLPPRELSQPRQHGTATPEAADR
jgi:hypothetical protein